MHDTVKNGGKTANFGGAVFRRNIFEVPRLLRERTTSERRRFDEFGGAVGESNNQRMIT
jgi:hypothetical protein